ncbi:MAG TPA: peptide chain release factor N(5)-glutamine methyltransferase [Methylomirabilota bacterium]|nr:peptide chain release factor N(5)-glutamine methyltransferase [Methylomirabilota bacterium]
MKAQLTARIGPVLREAAARLRSAGIATARQDAELLLARVLETTRLALHLEPTRQLPAEALAGLEALIARRASHEPLQYLLGAEDFGGVRLAVGPGVFIPRPETELLVERAVARCPEAGLVLDLCAGSGAVACAVAARRTDVTVWAVELAAEAAGWARANVGRLGLADHITVLEGDLFAPVAARAERWDLVVANPPYIARTALASLPAEVRDWEPALALDGGPDGLALIDRILDGGPAFVRPGGAVLLEIGHDHADRLRRRLAGDARYGPPLFCRDFLGYERVLEVTIAGLRPPPSPGGWGVWGGGGRSQLTCQPG